jgi:glycosyltransferase involved in cell wall biosynthesis
MKEKLIIYCPWGDVNKTNTLSSMPYYLIEALKDSFELIIVDATNSDLFKLSSLEKKIEKGLYYLSELFLRLPTKKKLQFGGVAIATCYSQSKKLEKIARQHKQLPILTFGNSATRFYREKSMVYQFIDGIFTYKIDYYINREKLFFWEKFNIKSTDFYGIKNSKAIFCTSETISKSVEDFSVKYALHNVIIKTVGTASNLPEVTDFLVRPGKDVVSICFIYTDFIRKNGEVVLKIAKLLENENFVFHFVGKKPVCNELECKNVIFHGFIDKNNNFDNYLNIIKQCDINIMPTKGDLTPHIICECNAYGIPTIANNIGGIKDLIGYGGELVTGYSPSSYVTAIKMVSNNLEERSKLSYQKYDNEQKWSIVAQKILNGIKENT